jgi:asparagine synthase (glutamine-hydrolysing)
MGVEMCGIAGFVDFKKASSQQILQNMTDLLHHRGPDDSGYSFYREADADIGFGHRRLSILDLSRQGHQPMHYENLEIIYNGEVYNFQEIRNELEKENYLFESTSDTEVILKAYHKWGIKAVDRFNGMFAIAIYDKQTKKVILIRDRAGVKPLYWYWNEGTFLFASELKSFHQYPSFNSNKKIDTNSLVLFLTHDYILQPHTIFQNTYKLRAAHYLEVDLKSQHVKEIKYWDVVDFYNKEKLNITFEDATMELEGLLKSAFEYRMISDVPVGLFLSGGYDSSTVAALLQSQRTQKLKTYTIGFYEQNFNEAKHAKKVADYLGTDHTEFYCTQKEALNIIPFLAEIYDEPFADSSAIPTILLSQITKKDVTVALSGDGGDETFAGYDKYMSSLKYLNFLKTPSALQSFLKYTLPIMSQTQWFGLSRAQQMGRINEVLKKGDNESVLKFMEYGNRNLSHKLLCAKTVNLKTVFDEEDRLLSSHGALNSMLATDYKTYLVDDILTKVDRATMSVGLESREPLLDYRIIEFSAQLPLEYKLHHGVSKKILRSIAFKHIPKKILNREKMGFGVPMHEWFQDELKELIACYLDRYRLEKEQIFNVDEVEIIKQEYLKNPINHASASKIWKLVMFEMWYERWM